MSRFGIYVYASICIAIIGAFAILAKVRCDFHLMNRAGATVAAITALAVTLQVYLEFVDSSSLSGKRQQIIRQRAALEDKAEMQPQAVNAIIAAELAKLERELLHRRLLIAGIVSFFAFVGEALHGWGDLLLEFLVG
jgi:hypothetical protein